MKKFIFVMAILLYASAGYCYNMGNPYIDPADVGTGGGGGDDFGSHVATQTVDMGGFAIESISNVTVTSHTITGTLNSLQANIGAGVSSDATDTLAVLSGVLIDGMGGEPRLRLKSDGQNKYLQLTATGNLFIKANDNTTVLWNLMDDGDLAIPAGELSVYENFSAETIVSSTSIIMVDDSGGTFVIGRFAAGTKTAYIDAGRADLNAEVNFQIRTRDVNGSLSTSFIIDGLTEDVIVPDGQLSVYKNGSFQTLYSTGLVTIKGGINSTGGTTLSGDLIQSGGDVRFNSDDIYIQRDNRWATGHSSAGNDHAVEAIRTAIDTVGTGRKHICDWFDLDVDWNSMSVTDAVHTFQSSDETDTTKNLTIGTTTQADGTVNRGLIETGKEDMILKVPDQKEFQIIVGTQSWWFDWTLMVRQ